MYFRIFKILVMTRNEVLNGLPKEMSEQVIDNMVKQWSWKQVDDREYIDEQDFLLSAFNWTTSFEGLDYWADYVEFTYSLDDLLEECIGDE